MVDDNIYVPRTAMVFAAGLGKRMRPLTDETPKPLIKIYGKPLVEYSLDALARAGVKRAVVNTHYMAEQIHERLKNYQKMKITFSHEKELLETGGGLLKALPSLGSDPFFVINGDIIMLDGKNSPALYRMGKFWNDEMNSLLLLQPVKKSIGYDGNGDFDLGPGQILKKNTGTKHEYVFTGIQLFHPRLLDGMELRPFSINFLYSKALQKDGTLKGFYGLVHDGDWLHIGTPKGRDEAEAYMQKYRKQESGEGW